ncbi:DUF373 family protein [Methanosarcinaceae archaeon]|nr:DUF373 family protein [Methanosarcinaceae archaeon]
METIVICIDRDNDLGEKAHVVTPVIGRGANITAAVNLATADPEDSDTNTIFGGIRILDELRSRGVDAEIVSFAGDKNVGLVSDKIITDQLDEFLRTHDVVSAVFVSDGAEDESLLPLVQSRLRIDGVRRIIVMQSENLESTYYMIKNFLRDPKVLQTILVPIGLALIVYAICIFAGYPQTALIGTLFLVGLYMILRGFRIDERLAVIYSESKKMFVDRSISLITTTASVLTFIVGTVFACVRTWQMTEGNGLWYFGFLPLIAYFISLCMWWYAGSLFLLEFGVIIDKYRAGRNFLDNISEMLFVLSGSLIIWTSSSYIVAETLPEQNLMFPITYFVYSIVGSIIIGLAAILFGAGNNQDDEIPENDEGNRETAGKQKKDGSGKKEKTSGNTVSGAGHPEEEHGERIRIRDGPKNAESEGRVSIHINPERADIPEDDD